MSSNNQFGTHRKLSSGEARRAILAPTADDMIISTIDFDALNGAPSLIAADLKRYISTVRDLIKHKQ